MLNRQHLLSDLQRLLRTLETDLLERSESNDLPEVAQTLRSEYQKAQKAERTAQSYEEWRSNDITQTGDTIRDWRLDSPSSSVWLYNGVFKLYPLNTLPNTFRLFWQFRAAIYWRKRFRTPLVERGLTWELQREEDKITPRRKGRRRT